MLQTFTFIGGQMHAKRMAIPSDSEVIDLPFDPTINWRGGVGPPDFRETYVRESVGYDSMTGDKSFFMLQGMDVYAARCLFINPNVKFTIAPMMQAEIIRVENRAFSNFGSDFAPKPKSAVSQMLDSADDNPDEMLRRILKKAQRHF